MPAPARDETVLLLGVNEEESRSEVVSERAVALDTKGGRVVLTLPDDDAHRAVLYLVGENRLFILRRLQSEGNRKAP